MTVAEVRSHTQIHNKDKLQIFDSSRVRNSFPLRIDITDLACTICNQTIKSVDDLKTHLTEKHSKKINPECTDGVIPFILTGKEYKCTHCDSRFEGLMKLFSHMNEHYQHYVCATCGKGFANRHKLVGHQKTHESGQLKCHKCDAEFSNRTARNRHLSKVHKRKDRHKCPICNEHFKSYHARSRHLDRTHGQKTDYKCNVCSAVFGTANLRYSHVRTVHLNKRKKKKED